MSSEGGDECQQDIDSIGELAESFDYRIWLRSLLNAVHPAHMPRSTLVEISSIRASRQRLGTRWSTKRLTVRVELPTRPPAQPLSNLPGNTNKPQAQTGAYSGIGLPNNNLSSPSVGFPGPL